MLTDTRSPLATVGLPEVDGDPQAQHRSAQAWRDLADHLADQSRRLSELTAGQNWQGSSAQAFEEQARALAERARQAVSVATRVEEAKRTHAEQHQQTLELLRQLAIEIGALLAFWVAAAAFPPLLAAANTWLTMLVAQGSRIIRFLVGAIARLVGLLVRARAWILDVMKLTWRTERFALGYGRFLTEGVRDFTIDLMANSVATAAIGKPIDPVQLFKNATIGGLVGGVFGLVERSGVTRVVDEAGDIVRTADGLPRFKTFSDQAKSSVNSLVRRADGTATGTGGRNPLFDHLDHELSHARELGLHGTSGEQRALAGDLRGLWATEKQIAARRADAQRAATEAVRRVREERRLLAGPDGSPTRLSDAERALTAAQRRLSGVQAEATSAMARAREFTERLDASKRLSDVRQTVRQETSLREQLSDAWTRNPWREPFQSRKPLPEVIVYDGIRYFLKGFASNAAKAASDVAMGTATPDDVWKRGLIGATTSSVRGIGNSFAGRFVIKDGIEDTLWKTGSKVLDSWINSTATPTH